MKSNFKILLVEDMESFRGAVSQMLGVYNDVDGVGDIAAAKVALQKSAYDVIILDKGLPDGDGINLISEIKETHPNAVIIILTSDTDFSSVKRCISLGADDYVIKSETIVPDLLVRIPVAVAKAASKRKLVCLEKQVQDAFKYEIVGKSPSTMDLRENILTLKGTNSHVFILGESGTGKELIARRLNAVEDDCDRPFVAINCGAIPENLIESELFGHKKGSFTGAVQDRPGAFEMAHNGDLFLDEIAELPLQAQVKLLRVIQEGEITRVGDHRPIKITCRIIAATNRDITKMVSDKTFREDLYHRLDVVRIATTPLRHRMNDIADLARAFTLQIGGPNYKINDRAIKALYDYDWPGNVRELRNTIERALISARKRGSQEVMFDDICIREPVQNADYRLRKLSSALPEKIKDLTPDKFLEFFNAVNTEYFRAALEVVNGNVTELADRIGLSRATVFRKLSDAGLDTPKKVAGIKSRLKNHMLVDRRSTQ